MPFSLDGIIVSSLFGEGNGNPLPYSCLENPVDRGASWAALHGVAQSRTRLKRLSMHACIGEGNGNPLQYSCLENPRDRGAWWAAIYGVTQSRTRLMQLSSSSKQPIINICWVLSNIVWGLSQTSLLENYHFSILRKLRLKKLWLLQGYIVGK